MYAVVVVAAAAAAIIVIVLLLGGSSSDRSGMDRSSVDFENPTVKSMLTIEILEEYVRVRTIIYKTLCNQY